MSPSASLILLEYNEYKSFYQSLGMIVRELIREEIEKLDVHIVSVTHFMI